MKKFLPFLLVVVFACKKQIPEVENSSTVLLRSLQTALKDSLNSTDWIALDWQQVHTYQLPGSDSYYVRVGFIHQSLASDFVLGRMGNSGKMQEGKIIHLERAPSTTTGQINIQTLDRKYGTKRSLHQGRRSFVQEWNTGISSLSFPINDNGEYLPEVIVVGYRSGKSVDMYNIQSFFDIQSSGSGSGGGYYGSAVGSSDGVPSTGNGGSSGGGGDAGGVYPYTTPEVMLELESDYTDFIASIDIRKYFNCFDLVPSAGASYSIQLCTDLPINSNADASARLLGGVSPGHTFLVVSKSNGSQSVTQSFGFYPEQLPTFWDPYAAVQSSIKDNGVSEINASIKMNITEEQFQVVKHSAIENASHPYLLGDYNCSDYALSVFNAIRPVDLSVNPFMVEIPSMPGMLLNPINFIMKHAPQTVFTAIQDIKTNNGPEAGNIQIDVSHSYRAPISHGECN